MGHYDITTKHLIEARPRDLLLAARFPLTAAAKVDVVDADLSTVSVAADKLIRITDGPATYLGHVEFQSGADAKLDRRMAVYNVLAGWRHDLEVRTAVFLLRPEAKTAGATGHYIGSGLGSKLNFEYDLIEVWKLPVDSILSGPVGALPLAPICDLSGTTLPGVVERIRERFDRETSPSDALELLTATRIIMGLRFDQPLIDSLLKGATRMQESVTYQEIENQGRVRGWADGHAKGRTEGRTEGRAEGELQTIIRQATRRFGAPAQAVLDRLNSISDPAELDRLSLAVLTAADWAELLG
jgi:predicted transposase YdaD